MYSKTLADAWRIEHGYNGKGGVVVVFGGKVNSWVNDLRNPEAWVPGCIAVDEHGNQWEAMGGNPDDGAERWEALASVPNEEMDGLMESISSRIKRLNAVDRLATLRHLVKAASIGDVATWPPELKQQYYETEARLLERVEKEAA